MKGENNPVIMIQIKIPGGKCLTSLSARHVATGSPTLKLACSRIERSRLAKGLGFCFLPFTVHPFTPPPSFPIHNSPSTLRATCFLLLATVFLPLLVAASIAGSECRSWLPLGISKSPRGTIPPSNCRCRRNRGVQIGFSLCALTRNRARTGHSQKIVPGLEACNHIRNAKPGPERSEGPAFNIGRKC